MNASVAWSVDVGLIEEGDGADGMDDVVPLPLSAAFVAEDDDDEVEALTTWYRFVVGLEFDVSRSFPLPFAAAIGGGRPFSRLSAENLIVDARELGLEFSPSL